jgi:hypothetical protein
MINKRYFFERAREFKLFGKLNQVQVSSIDYIINYFEYLKLKDLRWLAYIFATIKYETKNTYLPIEESEKGKGKPYGKKVKRNGVPYKLPHVFYERGFVSLKWFENYETMGRLLQIPLLEQPELALDVEIATKIMFEGMTRGASSFGDFTGRSLEQYFNPKTDDPIGARKIINGTDKAELIASYHHLFLKCLNANP